MATTTETLTTTQIKALRDEAGMHGDVLMAAICTIALGGNHEDLRDYEFDNKERGRIAHWSAARARDEVVRVIRNAEAQS